MNYHPFLESSEDRNGNPTTRVSIDNATPAMVARIVGGWPTTPIPAVTFHHATRTVTIDVPEDESPKAYLATVRDILSPTRRVSGADVAAWREREGLSRVEAAVKVGCNAETLARWERGAKISEAWQRLLRIAGV